MLNEAQKNLVKSAVSIFAEEGYTHAKIADIARKAEANIAAINYHFQSKENFFVEVLRYSFAIANEKYPVTGNLDDAASPEDRIRAFAEAILKRSFDDGPAGDFNRIMCKTIHAPGAPIQRILAEVSILELVTIEHAFRDLFNDLPQQIIELAKINLINLASIISQKPFFQERLLGESPSEKDIKNFICLQSDIVIASLQPIIQLDT